MYWAWLLRFGLSAELVTCFSCTLGGVHRIGLIDGLDPVDPELIWAMPLLGTMVWALLTELASHGLGRIFVVNESRPDRSDSNPTYSNNGSTLFCWGRCSQFVKYFSESPLFMGVRWLMVIVCRTAWYLPHILFVVRSSSMDHRYAVFSWCWVPVFSSGQFVGLTRLVVVFGRGGASSVEVELTSTIEPTELHGLLVSSLRIIFGPCSPLLVELMPRGVGVTLAVVAFFSSPHSALFTDIVRSVSILTVAHLSGSVCCNNRVLASGVVWALLLAGVGRRVLIDLPRPRLACLRLPRAAWEVDGTSSRKTVRLRSACQALMRSSYCFFVRMNLSSMAIFYNENECVLDNRLIILLVYDKIV